MKHTFKYLFCFIILFSFKTVIAQPNFNIIKLSNDSIKIKVSSDNTFLKTIEYGFAGDSNNMSNFKIFVANKDSVLYDKNFFYNSKYVYNYTHLLDDTITIKNPNENGGSFYFACNDSNDRRSSISINFDFIPPLILNIDSNVSVGKMFSNVQNDFCLDLMNRSGLLFLINNNTNDLNFTIYNERGIIIFQTTLTPGQKQILVPQQFITNGFYVVKLGLVVHTYNILN